MRTPRRDDALTPAVGVLVFAGLVVVMAICVHEWSMRAATAAPDPPRTLVLAGEGAVQALPGGHLKAWSVAAASAHGWYGDLRFRLGEDTLPCMAQFGASDAWRVRAGDGALPCDDAGVAPHRRLAAGDVLEVWDAGAHAAEPLRGRELQVVDVVANRVVLVLPVA